MNANRTPLDHAQIELAELQCFCDERSDVNDGENGPLPNDFMRCATAVEEISDYVSRVAKEYDDLRTEWTKAITQRDALEAENALILSTLRADQARLVVAKDQRDALAETLLEVVRVAEYHADDDEVLITVLDIARAAVARS